MTNAIGTSQDLALQPAAAAAQPKEPGADALKKKLDRDAVQGREAVQDGDEVAPPPPPAPAPDRPKGGRVDRLA